MFLNACCLTSKHLKKLYVCNNPFYVWKAGVGFSSSSNADARLIEDYDLAKPIMNDFFVSFNSGYEVFLSLHKESLMFMKHYLFSQIKEGNMDDFPLILEGIKNRSYIRLAQKYMNSIIPSSLVSDELKYLASDFSANDFKNHYKHEIQSYASKMKRIKTAIKQQMFTS